MSSYLITGVSRGLGFEFMRQLSADPKNTVVGLVRDKPTTDKKVSDQLNDRRNIHILQADVSDYDALKRAVNDTTEITGGALDYIIANAAFISLWSAFDPIGALAHEPKKLEEDLLQAFKTNVIGNIHLFNLFLPLIVKGRIKKVITISTGAADLESVLKFGMDTNPSYAISKAAMNMAAVKFSTQYSKEGILFMSICPGMVDTGALDINKVTEAQKESFATMIAKIQESVPHFKGPATPEASVKDVLSVINKASVENGDGGSYVSHFGNKQWL